MILFHNNHKYDHIQDLDNVEKIFYEVQKAINAEDMEGLRQLFTRDFFKRYSKQLFLNTEKINIENVDLENITNFKSASDGFSVDISFKAITYTKFDKNTIGWYRRYLAANYFSNKEIGENSMKNQNFKQRWFFTYESKALKVKKIKGIYIK